jgi:hypothetical protein
MVFTRRGVCGPPPQYSERFRTSDIDWVKRVMVSFRTR